ncbi:hypothetical protein CWR43_19055 [Rhizobium sullae]|uniref:Uncharacterized protein n=1 Tax=Rhizobium sullae TaxID=50338 RepID=A0A2N0D801_RHISU|nr:hypothetical protein CWR43_19055 [Rhizobium sullae]
MQETGEAACLRQDLRLHVSPVLKYRKIRIDAGVLGFNKACADMVDRFALHDRGERHAASASLH